MFVRQIPSHLQQLEEESQFAFHRYFMILICICFLKIFLLHFFSGRVLFCVHFDNLYVLKFGNRGSLEQHGFARNRIWEIDYNPPPLHCNNCDGKAFIDLLLRPSEEDMRIWPHR